MNDIAEGCSIKKYDIECAISVSHLDYEMKQTPNTSDGELETGDSPVKSDSELLGLPGKRRRLDQTETKRMAVSDDE